MGDIEDMEVTMGSIEDMEVTMGGTTKRTPRRIRRGHQGGHGGDNQRGQ